ncbi:winged helix-turn-helix domain-containing protein [Amycolatopsis sp.]|uniref:winged helix-turn-helix domain-containing protein n=1 Tax=Amycolatopsis sp. TaxID=37632 RepID=UPI002C6C26B1|nr:winged helix-turn-helix domain-containing protein [Amycolatopsis sp.]HVV10547.1 winged helix-turn-helix domain-containing protein [Amycolatopsis sp.]
MGSETTGLAPYERVASAIRSAVLSGELAPGAKLPSNRDLAQQQDVSLPTLQRAVALLQEEGWLVSRPSVGVFVSADPPKDAPPVSIGDLRRGLVDLRAAVSAIEERLDRLEAADQ